MQDRLAARGGVLPIEVPRPGVLWHGCLKIGHALVQHFHFALGGRLVSKVAMRSEMVASSKAS